jgi:hypothetical protein
MKKLCLLLLFSFAASARAENPESPTPSQFDKSKPAREIVQAHAALQQDQKLTTQIKLRVLEIPLDVERSAPIEISLSHLKVDGIVVKLVKTDNPFQLINPAASERYGPAEDDVVRELTTSKISGLKFLELKF